MVDQRPEMVSGIEVVSERQTGSILASIVTESMSTPRMFVVVEGFVTFLMARPNSSHVAIMVLTLLAHTENLVDQL